VTGEENGDQYPLLTAASWQLAVNKRLVFDVSRQLFDAGREQLAALYLTESFQSHSPLVAPGREGMLTELATRADRPIGTAIGSPLVAMFAEGDLVVQVTMHEHLHPSRSEARYTTTGFEMFRVSEGRLAEHWNAAGKPVDSECAADALRYVCGLRNAEDIVRVGTSRWLIASSIATRGEAVGAGRLYLIDAATGTAEELFPGADASLRPDAGLFGNCATIDLGAFDTHGLALRETAPDHYRLYVTSHGAVEAIQAFDVDASGARPAVAWIGCVPLPAKVWANSVAILADGGFVTSQFMDPTDPDSVPALLRGEPNGAVYEWHPGGAVAPIAGTELAGPNGIALSADERFLFVAAFGGRRVLRFDRGPEPGPPVVLEVDFVPDNLRWSERGTLLAAGSNPAGAGGWTIFEIDPDAMTGVALATIGPGAALQGASTAVQVGGQLWVGTPGGDRVGYLDLR
jgi:predicted SnoaL-like aldol condensation-catalyzing enzyme